MKRLALIGAIALPMLVASCSDTPVAPNASPPQYSVDNGLGKVAKYKNTFPGLGNSVSQVIGPLGGSIALAGFEVTVPAGAVSVPTQFTITLPRDLRKWGYVIADFGPSGIVFDQPVTLTLPFKGTSSEGDPTVKVLWNNGIDWVELPSWLTSDGRIQTQTTHFSEYGTEDPSRGITTAGG